MAEFNISPDVSRAIEDSAQPTPKAPAMAGQIAAARDKISRLLNKQTAGYSDIQDHGTALLRAAAGTSTYGEALNAINAKKIQSLQSAYKLLAEERKFQADEDERTDRKESRRINREISQGNLDVARERLEATKKAATPKPRDRFIAVGSTIFDTKEKKYIDQPDQGDLLSGKGMEVQLLNQMGRIAEKISRGDRLTPRERRVYSYGQTRLAKTVTRVDPKNPERFITLTTPLDPAAFPPLPGVEKADAAAPKAEGGPRVEVVGDKTNERVKQAMETIGDMAALLNDARKNNEDLGGLWGWVKSRAGGAMRTAGLPISTRAGKLAQKFEILQGLVGPDVLKDSRLSNQERARVERIVGGIDILGDEKDMREKLSEVVRLLQRGFPEGGK